MGTVRQYDDEFKKQAVKLGLKIGVKAAAEELCIPKGTLGTWLKKALPTLISGRLINIIHNKITSMVLYHRGDFSF